MTSARDTITINFISKLNEIQGLKPKKYSAIVFETTENPSTIKYWKKRERERKWPRVSMPRNGHQSRVITRRNVERRAFIVAGNHVGNKRSDRKRKGNIGGAEKSESQTGEKYRIRVVKRSANLVELSSPKVSEKFPWRMDTLNAVPLALSRISVTSPPPTVPQLGDNSTKIPATLCHPQVSQKPHASRPRTRISRPLRSIV